MFRLNLFMPWAIVPVVIVLQFTACEMPVEPPDIPLPPPTAAPDSPAGILPTVQLPTPDVSILPTPTPDIPLTVAPVPADLPRYDRKEWRHWVDQDKDCQDARQEVLIAESEIPVTFKSPKGCKVAAGRWTGPYTGKVVTDPAKLDVDHVVPLANAHRSGGWSWSYDRKRAYANDLRYPGHLTAAAAAANRGKGARGPEDWRPPDKGYWCVYALDWIAIKSRWGLTATPREYDALGKMLATCARPATGLSPESGRPFLVGNAGEAGPMPFLNDHPAGPTEIAATSIPKSRCRHSTERPAARSKTRTAWTGTAMARPVTGCVRPARRQVGRRAGNPASTGENGPIPTPDLHKIFLSQPFMGRLRRRDAATTRRFRRAD